MKVNDPKFSMISIKTGKERDREAHFLDHLWEPIRVSTYKLSLKETQNFEFKHLRNGFPIKPWNNRKEGC